ncbi:hypothetical protein ACLOJK_011119 [Asimina triloba]
MSSAGGVKRGSMRLGEKRFRQCGDRISAARFMRKRRNGHVRERGRTRPMNACGPQKPTSARFHISICHGENRVTTGPSWCSKVGNADQQDFSTKNKLIS